VTKKRAGDDLPSRETVVAKLREFGEAIPETDGSAPRPVPYKLFEAYAWASGLQDVAELSGEIREGAAGEVVGVTYLEAESFCAWLTAILAPGERRFYRVATLEELGGAAPAIPEWTSGDPPGTLTQAPAAGIGLRAVLLPPANETDPPIPSLQHAAARTVLGGEAPLGFRIALDTLDSPKAAESN
jgi:hypothetical protein